MFTKIELIERAINARNNEIIGDDEFITDLTNDYIDYMNSLNDVDFVNVFIKDTGIMIKKVSFDQFDLNYDIKKKSSISSYNRFYA